MERSLYFDVGFMFPGRLQAGEFLLLNTELTRPKSLASIDRKYLQRKPPVEGFAEAAEQ